LGGGVLDLIKGLFPKTGGFFTASFGLTAMLLAVLAALQPSPLEPDSWQLWVLFIFGAAQFLVSVLLATSIWRTADGVLIETGKLINGFAIIFAALFTIVTFAAALGAALPRLATKERLEDALAGYIEAATAERKAPPLSESVYPVFAACARVRTVPNDADRVLLSRECAALLGTPPAVDRAADALRRIRSPEQVTAVPSVSPGPSAGP
jgi:hypothetical protein